MKKRVVFTVLGITLSLILATHSYARFGGKGRGGGGWGANSQYGRKYDPKTVETINGEVVSLDKITPKECQSYGVHMMLKTDKETISVHLGPGWYIENQETQIQPKDKVEVKGSRITYDGKPVIIAVEIKRQDEVLVLRDENGFPAWSGWRRHRRP